ncbi:MAG: hypothetical protein LBD55_12025, partial [Treponema sp.]|nr:hypothetical protein [Treponema sp.]
GYRFDFGADVLDVGGVVQAGVADVHDGGADGQDRGADGFIVSEDGRSLGIVGMDIAVRDSAVGYIVKVHPSTGAELQRSSVNTINIRTVQFINNKIVALAGQNQAGGFMRLVEIDMNSLEITNQGTEDIPSESLLWVKGNNLYAIVSSGGNRYLARFDTNLSLQAQSAVPVHPYAAVTFQGDMLLLTQRDNGRALLLDPIDLTEGR